MTDLHDWRTVDPDTGDNCPPAKGCAIVGYVGGVKGKYLQTSRLVSFDGKVAVSETGGRYRLRHISTWLQNRRLGVREELKEGFL